MRRSGDVGRVFETRLGRLHFGYRGYKAVSRRDSDDRLVIGSTQIAPGTNRSHSHAVRE
jgi:hypothetical protein